MRGSVGPILLTIAGAALGAIVYRYLRDEQLGT
jgi:hypothetical protein